MTTQKEQPSVAQQLFFGRWLVSIPEMYLYDQAFIEQAGTLSSGDKAIDRQMAVNRREVMLTPVAMAIYLDEGAPLKLVNPKDAIEIYRYLNEHLLNWKHVIQTEFNYGTPPIEDLKKLEALASAMYPLASQFEDFKPREIGIFDKLMNIGRRSPISLHGPAKKKTEHEKVITDKGEQPAEISQNVHSPIMDAIARQVFKRG